MSSIEYLDRIAYRDGGLLQGFLIHTHMGLKKLNTKKIILFGVGECSLHAEVLLKEKGIDIFAYSDNSQRLWGGKLRGKKIYSPYELFGKEEYYFIIAVKYNIATVRLQFMAHNVSDYSIFFQHVFHDFQEEDTQLQEALIESMNMICFSNEDVKNALPYIPVAAPGERDELGWLNFMMYSTLWAHWAYLWEKEAIHLYKYHSVLEVGPGYGLMSLTLLKQFQDIHIDWLLLGKKGMRLEDSDFRFDLGLKKIKAAFLGRVEEYYCKLERDELPDKKYDMIILTEVFEHFVLNPVETMKKLANQLEIDGRMIVTTPNWGHVSIYQTWEDMSESKDISEERYDELLRCGHIYQYSKEELVDIFQKSGLCVEKYSISESNNHNFVLLNKQK